MAVLGVLARYKGRVPEPSGFRNALHDLSDRSVAAVQRGQRRICIRSQLGRFLTGMIKGFPMMFPGYGCLVCIEKFSLRCCE